MEPLVVALVVLVAVLATGGLLVASRGATGVGRKLPRLRPRLAVAGAPRTDAAGPPNRREERSIPIAEVAPIEVGERPVSAPAARRAAPQPAAAPEPGSDGRVAARLASVEERLGAIERRLERVVEAIREEHRAGRDSVGAAIASVEARQLTALERLRADLAAQAGPAPGSPSIDPIRERRAEATLGLYASLARFESALAQVTNPILLPGEVFAPPAEFLPESLAWENWKDVGERAFTFADAFSSQRLCLGDAARQEVAAFITTLRGTLTRAIYPNLVPDPTPEQLNDLRAALATLAGELPKVRRALEAEFRALAGDDAGANPRPRLG